MQKQTYLLALQIVGAAWHQAARALQPLTETDDELHDLWRQVDHGLGELERKIRRLPNR